MKICAACKIEKSIDLFYIRKTGRPQSRCKECQHIASRESYLRHYDANRIRLAKNYKEYSKEINLFIIDYLETHPCACGETDILVLEFHHLVPEEKEFDLSKGPGLGSLKRVKKELSKCRVMCVKCHRRETHKQQNSFKWQYINNISL